MTTRILHFIIQPVLVEDENGELTPGPVVDPVTVPLSGLTSYSERFVDELAKLNANNAGERS
ncbi:hypothetical protein M2390_000509 [Mycetocola sp. BIGb0189]|uniref:hypothetical protein n=1 Tax=Mycetocola sp. BIGb0189 TaxID=2940604 RepID=UPI002168EC4F|nr:hypothetical protein [Mycetocola sp. BIGb0189]MCS4275348.1 hypothetical protein [Mycetocola sp. BIGb0189]